MRCLCHVWRCRLWPSFYLFCQSPWFTPCLKLNSTVRFSLRNLFQSRNFRRCSRSNFPPKSMTPDYRFDTSQQTQAIGPFNSQTWRLKRAFSSRTSASELRMDELGSVLEVRPDIPLSVLCLYIEYLSFRENTVLQSTHRSFALYFPTMTSLERRNSKGFVMCSMP